MKKVGRRAALGGVLALGGAALLEYESLRGKLDHWRSAGSVSKAHYDDSLLRSESLPRALVHVGHSTHLIVFHGLRILTDPWFFDPAFGALAHALPPAVLPEEIGRLDVLLITHDHADHADRKAIDRLDKRALALVATNELAAKVRALGFGDVAVLAPWQERIVKGVPITAVPGLHDIYEIGFVIGGADEDSVYFAGDSRLHPDLHAIRERFRPKTAILSVDGTQIKGDPLWVMTPKDAAEASAILGSRIVIPSHADAVFCDPIASTFFATTYANAKEDLQHLLVDQCRTCEPRMGVQVPVPGPGDLVVL